MCFYFFFFKQKTAYEMRISDWSSDVCSSDLTGAVTRHGLRTPTSRADLRLEADPLAPVLPIIGHHTTKVGMSDFRRPILRPISRRSALRCVRFWAASLSPKIGRASCRERVCQYV